MAMALVCAACLAHKGANLFQDEVSCKIGESVGRLRITRNRGIVHRSRPTVVGKKIIAKNKVRGPPYLSP